MCIIIGRRNVTECSGNTSPEGGADGSYLKPQIGLNNIQTFSSCCSENTFVIITNTFQLMFTQPLHLRPNLLELNDIRKASRREANPYYP
jgi:hypothetical protein